MHKFSALSNIDEMIEILSNQIGIVPNLCHYKYTEYKKLITNIDCCESGFRFFYEKFIRENIGNKIPGYRIVCSSCPSIVCSMPFKKIFHQFNHPMEKNGFSVFVPFTKWFENNSISVHGQKNIVICECDKYDVFMIPSNSMITVPDAMNQINNTSMGISFFVMSYENYKSSKLYESKKIGDFLSLL